MKYHEWLRATAAKSTTISNIRHKCFLSVINNGNCCLAASVTAINSPNCQSFHWLLSSQWRQWGEAGFPPPTCRCSAVWAAWTGKAFLSAQPPSLVDINSVNDTLTDARNLEGFSFFTFELKHLLLLHEWMLNERQATSFCFHVCGPAFMIIP